MSTQTRRLPLYIPETNCFPVLIDGCMTQVLSLRNSFTHSVAHRLHALVMNRLCQMNVRVLLNTRIDLNSLQISPNSPYTCSTSINKNVCTPDLSPTISMSAFSESPCPTPPPISPHLASCILPPPIVQTEDLPTTITTMDGRKMDADLIVGPLHCSFILLSHFSHPSSCSAQARHTTPHFWRCCHPDQLITRAGLLHMSPLLSNLGLRQTMGRFNFLITPTFLSLGMQLMLSGPENLAAQPGTR